MFLMLESEMRFVGATAGSTGLTAEQLVQQLYAQLIGQGFSSEQAMMQVNAQLPAILAGAQ